ncbi:hypothetical protein PQX77_020986 [Marasmius sp. AFHP31]|nr:hypothetical protein PQX77_020986 [Marasmius sp. AFHP31]
MTQPSATPPPLHFDNTFSGGKNNNNFYTGTQNINEGRDMNLNTGGGTMNINSYSSKDEDEEDEEDEEDDKPYSEKMLRIELRAFNRQRSKLNETALKEIDGQEYLDKWQRMIISDLPGKIISSADRLVLLDAMIQLSHISGLAPKCLRIQDIGIQDLAPVPDMQFADVEFFKGKIGDMDVSVKAPKKQPRPDDRQLETFLQQAIVWRRLEHQNVLPFLGLYYFDEARSRVCLVSPWMENSAAGAEVKPEDCVKGVAAGLFHLHSQKVVHGDLNVFNIFINSAGISRIGDLGLPQLLGKAADKSEDVYRFGRLSFKLFGGTSLKGKDGPLRPLGVSNPMWEVIKKCLNTSPSSRPLASDIAEALSRYTNPIAA